MKFQKPGGRKEGFFFFDEARRNTPIWGELKGNDKFNSTQQFSWIKANLKENDEIVVVYTYDDANNKALVTSVSKKGVAVTQAQTPVAQTQATTAPTSNNNYKSKYTKGNTYNNYKANKEEGNDGMRRGACLHATSRALMLFVGHVDPNKVDMIEALSTRLFKHFYKISGLTADELNK